MAYLGAVAGFVVGFLLGQVLLLFAFSGGRHLVARERPALRFWAGLANLMLAVVGAVIGYKMA